MEAFDFGDIPEDLPMISVDELLPEYLDDLSHFLPHDLQNDVANPGGALFFSAHMRHMAWSKLSFKHPYLF